MPRVSLWAMATSGAGLVKSRLGSAGAHGAARPSLTGRGVGLEARAPRALVFPPLVLTFHEP